MKKNYYLSLFFLLMIGCQKEDKTFDTNHKTFIHSYVMPGSERCYSLSVTNNGYLIICSKGGQDINDENSIVILRTDKSGNLISSNTIENDSFFIPWISQQSDGSFLIGPNELGRHLYKLDNNGNILFKSRFETRTYYSYFSLPIMTKDRNYALAASSYTFQNDEFILFDQNGIYKRSVNIKLPTIVKAADHICLYQTEDTATYFYYGIERNNNANARIFIAKQSYEGSNLKSSKSLIVDANNTSDQNFPESRVNLKHLQFQSGGVLLYNTQLEPGGNYKGYLAMIDKDLNKLWEKNLKISNASTSPKYMINCMDGNILIVGSCTSVNNMLEQPFICKIDLNGNVIWSKIYSLEYSGSFNSVVQLSENEFLFGGTTNSFGKGLNLNDIFLLKTDSAGNLKIK